MSIDAGLNSPDLISSSKLAYSRISTEPESSTRGHSEDEERGGDRLDASSPEHHAHHHHHHQEQHCAEDVVQDDSSNLNVRAAIIHVIGDFIQSIGVLVAAIVIKFAVSVELYSNGRFIGVYLRVPVLRRPQPHLKAFDPICTFVFSLIVLVTTVRIFRDSMRILVDAVPVDVSLERLSSELAYIEGVKTVHDLRVWSVSTGWNVMTVHLMIGTYLGGRLSLPSSSKQFYIVFFLAIFPPDPLANASEILATADHIARHDFRIKHSTVQIEKMHF